MPLPLPLVDGPKEDGVDGLGRWTKEPLSELAGEKKGAAESSEFAWETKEAPPEWA